MKHLKIKIMSIALLAAATSSMAQSLDKMNWLNEPQQWEIKDGKLVDIKHSRLNTIGDHYFNTIMNEVMDEYYAMLKYIKRTK